MTTKGSKISTKRKHSSTSDPPIVYVLLKRTSTYLPHRDKHDVSCVSVHTSMAAANWAALQFFKIGEDHEDRETGWYDWEDLCGTRVQTNSEGFLRIIKTTDTRKESLVWVEKKSMAIEEEESEEGSGNVAEIKSGKDDRQGNHTKRRKVRTQGSK